jgi:tetratricopeptide (TPR) repeat protein
MKIRRFIPLCIFCFALTALLTSEIAGGFAQDAPDYDAERRRALELLQANRIPEAVPLLEKLHKSNPDDPVVLEWLAATSFAATATETDASKRKELFLRARALAERAKELGRDSQLMQLILDFPADGEVPEPWSSAKPSPAIDTLREGEAAFARGEMDLAIRHYTKAHELDPDLYEAPLFIGDAYFTMGNRDKAYDYYARAVLIDSDRDTAYRYWGNVLLRAGKLKEAKEKLVEGVISAPYAKQTWQFLLNWAERRGIQLSHPCIDIPVEAVRKESDKNIRITVNPPNEKNEKDGSSAWMLYSISRAGWMMDTKLFSEAYPNEKEYRHSLREESSSLALVVSTVQRQLKEGELKEKISTCPSPTS